ncbi:poly(U)-specific endoribonuclease-like [Cyclopterus lumpus]|uniref:poly(U)-specific endoribonuclease-like n=1 Tax=Cyclopterus lumpus TaxID=8103 RepID=UPI001486AF2A|nr:poly(U)-specific endoribonuclease-like [Cyclopterus lumpus]
MTPFGPTEKVAGTSSQLTPAPATCKASRNSGLGSRPVHQPDKDVLDLQFSRKGLVKPGGGCFIVLSPQFEVALFVIFLMSTQKMTPLVKVVQKQCIGSEPFLEYPQLI